MEEGDALREEDGWKWQWVDKENRDHEKCKIEYLRSGYELL